MQDVANNAHLTVTIIKQLRYNNNNTLALTIGISWPLQPLFRVCASSTEGCQVHKNDF